MTYLDYFKSELKRSFFMYSIMMLVLYLIDGLFSEAMRNNLFNSVPVTATGVFMGVLIQSSRNYKNKKSIRRFFDI